MEKISQIINKITPSNKIERATISNYDSKIMGGVWMSITQRYIEPVVMGTDGKFVWNNLIRWAMNIKCDIDPLKGIGLIGCTGSGKTITMRILNDFISIDNLYYKRGNDKVVMRFTIESALVIAGQYSRLGYDSLNRFSQLANLCIDDLGAENPNKKHFGDSVNVIQEIIENRYANGLMTHFTSNLKPDDIQEMYGDRVHSRLMDSVNIIEMNDKDYRIK